MVTFYEDKTSCLILLFFGLYAGLWPTTHTATPLSLHPSKTDRERNRDKEREKERERDKRLECKQYMQ